MDRDTPTIATNYPALRRFAEALHDRLGAANVLLFGSRARGQEGPDSDYDVIIVAPRFADIRHVDRSLGIRQLWRQVGGYGPLDLICVTPDEFEEARHRITLVAEVLPEAVDLTSHSKSEPAETESYLGPMQHAVRDEQ